MKIDVFNHLVTPRYHQRRLQIAPPKMRLQEMERAATLAGAGTPGCRTRHATPLWPRPML